jgi:glycosyltransferase involved in cell wall biosynthesis
MRTLHVVQNLFCAGIEKIVMSMMANDYENTFIFVLQRAAEESYQSWPEVLNYKDHIFFAHMEHNGKTKTLHNLRDICKRLGITSIHSHYTGPLLFSNLATMGLKNLNHIHTEHDAWHLSIRKNRLIEQSIFYTNKRIHLVAVSKQIQDSLKIYFPNKNSKLIYNGVNTNLFTPKNQTLTRHDLHLPESAILIGTMGRLVPIKGHKYLVQALSELPENYHLAIAGEGGQLAELIELTKSLHLESRVHFLGFIPEPNTFYPACDIFCLPSMDEGLPLVILEAQAANIPVVCSDVGSCKEGIDPHTGMLVEAGNSNAIAKACLHLDRQSGSPREFIINNFSLDSLISQYNHLYRGVSYGSTN